jgi:hypothetical protein
MAAHRRPSWKSWLALLATLAFLVVSNAVFLPAHSHGSFEDRTCALCRSGHMPTLEPYVSTQVQAAQLVEWRIESSELSPILEAAARPNPPRAPPA